MSRFLTQSIIAVLTAAATGCAVSDSTPSADGLDDVVFDTHGSKRGLLWLFRGNPGTVSDYSDDGVLFGGITVGASSVTMHVARSKANPTPSSGLGAQGNLYIYCSDGSSNSVGVGDSFPVGGAGLNGEVRCRTGTPVAGGLSMDVYY